VCARRYVSPELMKRIVEEAIAEGSVSVVARRYQVHRNSLSRWIAQYRQGQVRAGDMLSASTVDRIIEENRELKRLLGEKELQVKIMEDLLKKTAQRSGTKLK
jgi:transposase